FWECVEPRKVDSRCPYCNPAVLPFFIDDNCTIPFINLGVGYEYWWPETEIEINNFGISAISAVTKTGGIPSTVPSITSLSSRDLAEGIDSTLKENELREYLEKLSRAEASLTNRLKFEKGFNSVNSLLANL